MMYGLINQKHLDEMAEEVCECLGGGENAINLLLETAGAETNRGQTKDLSIGAGMGITQIDRLPFLDIKDRLRQKDKEAVYNHFNIDTDLVKWEHLRYNPLLCLIFTRLKYKKVPEAIPTTEEGRAKYWKKYYNSIEGKGTIAHYVLSIKHFFA